MRLCLIGLAVVSRVRTRDGWAAISFLADRKR